MVYTSPLTDFSAGGWRIPQRSASRNHSWRKSVKAAFAAAGRATTTIQKPDFQVGRESRRTSRSRRRTRFRTTAPPIRRVVMSPALVESRFLRTPKVIYRPPRERPSVFTRRNSELRVSRTDFGKVSARASEMSHPRVFGPPGRERPAQGLRIRLGYGARNGFQRPWAGGAGVHVGDGGRE